MIFGFNSDVQCGEIWYHVQSEIQAKKYQLETHIFMQGRYVGRQVTALGDAGTSSEQEIQDMLKEQHREVLEAIRAGRLEEFAEPES
jgi:hypothetical protein